MSEEQRRQYEQLQQCLTNFRARSISLSDLIERLPTLIKNIDDPDPIWKEECIGCWWTLEQIHEDAIELGESRRMPPESRKQVDDAIDRLGRLVNGALETV